MAPPKSFIIVMTVILALATYFAYRNSKIMDQCVAKGGVAVQSSSGIVCIKKDVVLE